MEGWSLRGEGRVISESEHQKGKVIPLCKLFKGRVTLLFQIFFMRMDKLPKNTGRILPRRDWKSEYYRLLDLESTQVRHLSKCYLLVGFLAHHVLFMWPRNLDLSISRDALGRTYNNHKVLHRLSQTPRIRYMNTFPE